ncbi:MAG: 50S ribosomal protein L5 [Candidatus Dojkabacteria bacterium]|jgi:large subunit ribosomal protein L5|nr:50S ribosomal protein L5 [Candidatus Dojkabacteria bacterium]
MSRLREEYKNKIMKELLKEEGFSNVMAVPTLKKIVLNVGVSEATTNSEVIEEMVGILTQISGQKPIVTKAKKAISSFKVREGMDLGVTVTLRGERMWDFFDKLVNVVFPRTKDFRGLSVTSFDGAGNYSIGIEDHTVFPEIDANNVRKIRSLQVTIVTTAKEDKSAKMFLDKFGFPFREDVNKS